MSQSYSQPGCTLTLLAPYARASSGLGAQVGAIFGVTTAAVESGAAGEFMTEGVHLLQKIESQAWAVGDRIYWDDTEKECTSDSTKGMFIGVATAVAASAADGITGYVKLAGPQNLAEGAQAYLAPLTMGVNITAATANGSLTDSSGTNPTEAQFNELAKEVGTRLNAITAAMIAAGLMKAS